MARTPVYDEWEKFVTAPDRSPELQEPGWRELYATCFQDGQWTVSLSDSRLVTHLGVTIKLGLGRFREASEISQRFFNHPDSGSLMEWDWIDWAEMKLRHGASLILEGKAPEGIALFEEVLSSDGEHPGRPFLVARNCLRDLFIGCPRECDYAFEELKRLVARLLSIRPGNETFVCPSLASIEELLDCLNSTYPARD